MCDVESGDVLLNALESDCRVLWSLVFDEAESFGHGVLEWQSVVDVDAAEYCYYVEQCADEHCGVTV